MRTKPVVNRTQPDWVIAIIVLILVAFGVLMVFEASIVEAFHEIGNQWYFIGNQSKYSLIGIFFATLAFLFPLKKLEKLSLPIMISALLLLILVLIPGIGIKVQGAQRWMDIGPIRIQPSEYAKLATIIYFSAWFSKPRPVRSFAVLLAVLIGLVMLEPDMGTALVISGISAVMYFLSGAPLKKIFNLALAGVMCLIVLIGLAPYRMDRVKTFLDPTHDPLGVSYHARQVLISLGSGGLFGTGLGRSRQKFQYLPEASTDSIFAVVGEEFGLFGGLILILLLASLVIKGLTHARAISDPFIANLSSGIAIWIGVQVLLNLMAMVGIVPLTGVPLPFISYGGSALITILVGIGLFLNATTYRSTPTKVKEYIL